MTMASAGAIWGKYLPDGGIQLHLGLIVQPLLCFVCISSGSKVLCKCFVLENTRSICRVASSIDCDIDCVSCWFGAVPCTLGTDWVLFGFVVCTLGTDGVVLSGVVNDLVMVGCWWNACSVSSASCRFSSAPWELLMSLIVFTQAAIAFIVVPGHGDLDIYCWFS